MFLPGQTVILRLFRRTKRFLLDAGAGICLELEKAIFQEMGVQQESPFPELAGQWPFSSSCCQEQQDKGAGLVLAWPLRNQRQ